MKHKTVLKKHDVKNQRTNARKGAKKQWKELGPGRRALTTVFSLLQVSLAVAAWIDLARRPQKQIRGRKGIWVGVIAVNYIGPIAYFLKGRQPD